MHDDMKPDNTNMMPTGETDREGAMAKADLHKLANYSIKLFKKIEDEDQLEGWVQAKITKAADYIASVYHYLEYEMKISEYGSHLETAEMYSESQKAVIKNKLLEAKEKVAQLKKLQAGKKNKEEGTKSSVKEGSIFGGHEESCHECGGTGMIRKPERVVPETVKAKVEKYNRQAKAMNAASKRIDRNKNGIPDSMENDQITDEDQNSFEKTGATKKTPTGILTKTDSGVIHKNTSYKDDGEAEEKSGKGGKSHAKAQSAAEKKEKAPAQKQSKSGTWGMKNSEKFDTRKKEKEVDETYGQGVYEAKKKGDGNLANNAKPYDKVTRGDVVAGRLGKDEKGGKDQKVKEELKGGQKKLDVSEPKGKLTGADFKALGNKKKVKETATEVWKKNAQRLKEAMTDDQLNEEDSNAKAVEGLIALALKTDEKNALAAMEKGDEAFTTYLQGILAKGDVTPDQATLDQAISKVKAGDDTEGQPANSAGTDSSEEAGVSYSDSLAESTDFDRMKQLMTRLNG